MNKSMVNNIKKKKKGFTLVELIIVIAIIAILAALAIPKFSAVRAEAKVSNDVAAAKNIQTTVATLIANGTIKPATGDTVINVADATDKIAKAIRDRLDGKAKDGNAEAIASTTFEVTVKPNEDIIVKAGTYQLYPETDTSGKTAYLAQANGTAAKADEKKGE
jgi:type IV pilus assembly protein PilA